MVSCSLTLSAARCTRETRPVLLFSTTSVSRSINGAGTRNRKPALSYRIGSQGLISVNTSCAYSCIYSLPELLISLLLSPPVTGPALRQARFYPQMSSSSRVGGPVPAHRLISVSREYNSFYNTGRAVQPPYPFLLVLSLLLLAGSQHPPSLQSPLLYLSACCQHSD